MRWRCKPNAPGNGVGRVLHGCRIFYDTAVTKSAHDATPQCKLSVFVCSCKHGGTCFGTCFCAVLVKYAMGVKRPTQTFLAVFQASIPACELHAALASHPLHNHPQILHKIVILSLAGANFSVG